MKVSKGSIIILSQLLQAQQYSIKRDCGNSDCGNFGARKEIELQFN